MRCRFPTAAPVLAALLALAGPSPSAAQDAGAAAAARQAAAALEAAAAALEAAEGARDRVAALTRTVKAYEAALAALRDGLREAAIRERTIALELEAKRAEIARLTGVLMAIGRNPPGPLLLLHPGGALGTARSGMMLAEVAPALEAEAARLAAQLAEAAALRAVREAAAADLEAGLRGAQEARTALARAIAERTDLPRREAEDPEALARLLEGAETLESYAAGLLAVPLAGAAPGGEPFRSARGRLPLPVQGSLLRGFDEPDAAGVRRPGLILATRPLALVTAPWAATVRYAGPLPGYGNVIILEPEAGYLIVLAGLGRLFVGTGEVVAAGMATGLMGGEAPGASEFLGLAPPGSGGGQSESLYMELRVGGAPVDPAAWFALERG
jgi:septal ring factor EnvC (AmiA/AmiB activator)